MKFYQQLISPYKSRTGLYKGAPWSCHFIKLCSVALSGLIRVLLLIRPQQNGHDNLQITILSLVLVATAYAREIKPPICGRYV